jgi:hypothetical protein
VAFDFDKALNEALSIIIGESRVRDTLTLCIWSHALQSAIGSMYTTGSPL